MREWNKLSNTEIRIALSSMEMEYEAIKNKINSYFTALDNLDREYIRGKKELEERSKK